MVSIPSFLKAEGEMSVRIAAYPWATHPMGSLDAWPQSLRTAVSLILNSQHPMWIGWGDAMWFLYNDAYLHVLGMAKHPWALGRPASEVWAEIWDVCGPLADKVFRLGEASFVDDVQLFMNRGAYLEETFYSFSYSPIRGENGGVAGLFCPSNDVTAKVVGARRLRTLSELAANALVQRSTMTACSSAASTLEKNADDIPFAALYLAQGNGAVFHQAVRLSHGDASAHVPDAVAVLATGRPKRLSVAGSSALALPMAGRADVRPLGVLIAGLNPARPLDDEHRTFFELVASNIGTSIANARAAEEEKKRADMLAEMDRAKTVFFSNISHEFRTPLTLMLGPLDQLMQSGDERDRTLAQTARRNALRLLKLVNTLLEFSRLEAGRSDAAYAPTRLDDLTRDIASSFRSAIESAGLSFLVDAELDEEVYVDRSMWERILLNLLSNALKFTFEGEIEVSLRRRGETAELAVRDTGVGIAPDDLPGLFERFHRVRGAKSRTHEGSGIGLALVRDLAALHGGEVTAESSVGEGTTFRVRVPLGRAHLDPTTIVEGEPAAFASSIEQYLADIQATVMRAATIGSAPGTVGGRARILLADDNSDLREYVGGILTGRYDVTAVSNGLEALEAARTEPFDLIVSDVMMPEMDGFELLRTLRADERLASIPFIMLSARAGEESALEGLMEGADDYIVKPFSAEELRARVYAQLKSAEIRERATRDLRASEERFRTLAASLPYIVFESTADGAITFLSNEYEHFTGERAESAYGSRWTHIVHPDHAAETEEQWERAILSGDPFATEFKLRRHDGSYRFFTARALAQRDADGAIARWTGTMVDVHDQRRAAREREFLARASEIFAQQLDLQQTLESIASFMIPELADWCQIDVRTDDGRIRTVALAHRDADLNHVAQAFLGRVHLNATAAYGAPHTIRTGRSQLLTDISVEAVEAAVDDPDETRMYVELGLSSAIVVPLVAEGQTFGALSAVYGASHRKHSEDDLPMLEEVGRRAGLAIHKAKLFEREHRAAESFQAASLPASLPRAPGLTIDAFYAPGRAEAQVGGDWYDALRLADGRVVISIGDVAGSGLQAAVTMGNMRQIIRGIAQVHADPALMLDAADRALRLEYPDKFATAFVGVFDVITGSLTYASAGHPPPLLRDPDGTVTALGDAGLPLGLRSNGPHVGSTSVSLREGAALVLYTDGLTEIDRAPELGEARLRDVFGDGVVLWQRSPARAVVEAISGGRTSRDDVAVLVVSMAAPLESDAEGRPVLQRWSFHTGDVATAGEARATFAAAFRARGAGIEDVAMAEVVLGELVSNTVRYAPGNIDVIADWSAPEPVLHVLDSGPGFRHIAILPPDLMSESGRGLFIVSALTADFRVSKRTTGGSHARAVLRLQSRQLVDTPARGLSGSLLYALTEGSGGILTT